MKPGDVDRDLILSNGWAQGAVSRPSSLRPVWTPDWFNAIAAQDSALVILISHDCDLLNRSLSKEPWAEWLVAVPVKKVKSQYANGLNCRTFHFEHSGVNYETTAHLRLSTPREVLQSLKPSAESLRRSLMDNIAAWLGKRFVRAAFPDEFNRRLSPVDQEIRSELDADHSLLRSILIKVDPNTEISESASYNVSLVGVMSKDDFLNGDNRVRGEAVLVALEKHLDSCTNIFADAELRPSDKVTLEMFEDHVPWDFDYLTFRDSND